MRISFHPYVQIMILFMNFYDLLKLGFYTIATLSLNLIPHDIIFTHKHVLMIIHGFLGPYHMIHAIPNPCMFYMILVKIQEYDKLYEIY